MEKIQSIKEIRIDKFLWCIRFFKTRTLATDSCIGGKVKISGESVKPSRMVKIGEVITVQQGYVKRTILVINLLERRVSAKMVNDYIKDLTPESEKTKSEIARLGSYMPKFKFKGRPTKRERRILDKYWEK
jgi:ribosome-associated heat shock protein Hsp15